MPITLQEAYDIMKERIGWWADYRSAKFAPQNTYLGSSDMIELASMHLYLQYPNDIVNREEDTPKGRTWKPVIMNPDQFEEEDKFFTKEYWTDTLNKLLEPLANKDIYNNKTEEDED